jgi:hypothetical protein
MVLMVCIHSNCRYRGAEDLSRFSHFSDFQRKIFISQSIFVRFGIPVEENNARYIQIDVSTQRWPRGTGKCPFFVRGPAGLHRTVIETWVLRAGVFHP